MEKDIIENSNITQYQKVSKALGMNVDKNAKQLEYDKNTLLRIYPHLGNKELEASNFFDEIVKKEFIDGITKKIFVRNYMLENSSLRKLAFRPERTPEDYLSKSMPDDKTLLFKGYVRGDFFVIYGVSEQYAEELLPYEVECKIVRYDDLARLKARSYGGNFLFDLADASASLNMHTRQRLVEWKNYIEWRRNIVKARMNGVKYIRVESEKDNLVFTLQFNSKEEYEVERKWLQKGELAAYDGKEYADNNGKFSYDEKNNNHRETFQPLGNFIRRASHKGRQVGNHFEIELTYAIPDRDELEEMNEDERIEYVQNRLLSHYPERGFLAPLVVKDLSLFFRLERAADNLQKDLYCASPNIAMWIFDVSRARLPQPKDREKWIKAVGDDWLNKSVAENENQREAILKMLAAPDLCLIQGPPGTGKTTVIAEAIYQFAKQGNRVLLASQSHDAVDNALERLVRRTEIRAVRLGERARLYNEESSPFSKNKVLSTYYSCLRKSIYDSFLKPWEDNRRQYDSCELELRDWRDINADLSSLNEQLLEIRKEWQQSRTELSTRQKEFEQALTENAAYESARLQYQDFVNKVNNDDSFDDLHLPEFMGSIFSECFISIIKSANEHGIKLFPSLNEDVIKRDPNLFLRTISNSFRQIKILRDRLVTARKNIATDSEFAQIQILELQRKIDKITELMDKEDDINKWKELKRERNNLREEKENLKESGALTFSKEELSLLDDKRQAQINSADERESLITNINEVIDGYEIALKNSARCIGENLDAYQPKDTDALDEIIKSLKGRISYLAENGNRLEKEIAEKMNFGQSLSEKYSCERNDIEMRINEEMSRLNSEWERDSEIRNVWANALDKFTFLLDKPETAKYDEQYYLDIYLKSCNVVGITCAANMKKELDEHFPDFDVVIIDEVSKATPPELLQPLMRGRKTILVGDHRQLPPVFDEYESSYNELIEKINAKQQEENNEEFESTLKKEDLEKYKSMVTASLFREYFEAADDKIKHSLLTQYRMHSDIQKVINRFYDGKLKSGLLENENTLKAHGLKILTNNGESFLRPDSHAYWIDSSKLQGKIMEQSCYPGSTSLHNIFERYIILAILIKLNEAYSSMNKSGITVGVISFYGSQVGDLRKAVKILRNEGKLKALRVDVNTVDRFQGKEKEIIITSLVCNTKRGTASKHVAAFERINVAFSRAQNLLIIVGAKNLYERLIVSIPDMDTGEPRSTHIYQSIIDDIARNGALISGETLISVEDTKKIHEEYDKEAATS